MAKTNMENQNFKLVGSPCGHHGQYSFYKAFRYTSGGRERILAISDFFFVRLWQDSELVSIGELQLLWTDRTSDQTLVSLRLYFLPENTPDGRSHHGQDEVVAISEAVVVRAEDLLSWVCGGAGWRWGLRAVWRGACQPPPATAPLHAARLDFADVEKEKSAIDDPSSPGVVVFSYPRYCRYRALLRRLEGMQAEWLRDSLVAALGGYAAPTQNTRILYCKETFEYPELEGHEFVCNHLAPRVKGRPRGRRRRRVSPAADDERDLSDDSERADERQPQRPPTTPGRPALRAAVRPTRSSGEEERSFLQQLRQFHAGNDHTKLPPFNNKELSLRALYVWVLRSGGYESVCRTKAWRRAREDVTGSPASPSQATLTRRNYERILLAFEKYERRNGSKWNKNIKNITNGNLPPIVQTQRPERQKKHLAADSVPIATIDISDSPVREIPQKMEIEEVQARTTRLRTPSPLKSKYHKRKLETPAKNEKEKENVIHLDIETKEDKEADERIKISEEKEEEALNSYDPSNILNLNIGAVTEDDTKNVKRKEEEIEKRAMESPVKEAADLNQEFLDSLPRDEETGEDSKIPEVVSKKEIPKPDISIKISVKPPEKLLEKSQLETKPPLSVGAGLTGFLQNQAAGEGSELSYTALAASGLSNGQLPNGTVVTTLPPGGGNDKWSSSVSSTTCGGVSSPPARGRVSSLRSVRVKPARQDRAKDVSTCSPGMMPPLRPDSASSSTSPVTSSMSTATGLISGYPAHRPTHHNQVTSSSSHQPAPDAAGSDDEIIEVPYKPNTPEIIDLDLYESPESPQSVKRKKLDILKERGLEVTAVSNDWSPASASVAANPALRTGFMNQPNAILGLNPVIQQQILNQAQFIQMYNAIMPPGYTNGFTPPKVTQGKSIYGSSGPEKTVYGNPKDPFMPPPHVLQGAPPKHLMRTAHKLPQNPGPDILDLTCKTGGPSQKPSVEIMRVPSVQSPAPAPKSSGIQNLSSKSYSIVDGKAVVGSNLEITLVGPKMPSTPPKPPRPPQKRTSTGKFMSNKAPQQTRDVSSSSKSYAPNLQMPNARLTTETYTKLMSSKPSLIIPSYQASGSSEVSPGSSGTLPSLNSMLQGAGLLQTAAKPATATNAQNLGQLLDPSFYMSALYSSLTGQLTPGLTDQHQLAMYKELMSGRLLGRYPGLVNSPGGATTTPTSKN